MGAPAVTGTRPAFYARTGQGAWSDLIAILHPPYTLWHLSYVVLGAALAPQVDWLRLAGTLAAFFLGTGIGAHALDERHGHPLGTRLGQRTLALLGGGGLAAGAGLGVAGAFAISPWLLAWSAAGVLLAAGYTLEWDQRLHSDLGFALAWGAFPVLVGYWAQAETLGAAVVLMALTATLLSLAQRSLSTPARFVRRHVATASASLDGETWSRERLLASWERPLLLLAAAVTALAVALLA